MRSNRKLTLSLLLLLLLGIAGLIIGLAVGLSVQKNSSYVVSEPSQAATATAVAPCPTANLVFNPQFNSTRRHHHHPLPPIASASGDASAGSVPPWQSSWPTSWPASWPPPWQYSSVSGQSAFSRPPQPFSWSNPFTATASAEPATESELPYNLNATAFDNRTIPGWSISPSVDNGTSWADSRFPYSGVCYRSNSSEGWSTIMQGLSVPAGTYVLSFNVVSLLANSTNATCDSNFEDFSVRPFPTQTLSVEHVEANRFVRQDSTPVSAVTTAVHTHVHRRRFGDGPLLVSPTSTQPTASSRQPAVTLHRRGTESDSGPEAATVYTTYDSLDSGGNQVEDDTNLFLAEVITYGARVQWAATNNTFQGVADARRVSLYIDVPDTYGPYHENVVVRFVAYWHSYSVIWSPTFRESC
ncbi:uncharacterized protein V1510DRAFT_414068 [Dipodascopsis tothii]|uniref:uncharacterized protein n=1 Tax=Dipodascopsis tothii TaxID=44089 RepID=UPI0034CE8978